MNDSNNTPLMLAVLNGHVTVMDVLVKEFNSSCHIRGFRGYTLLHSACDRGHIELIDKLVMEYMARILQIEMMVETHLYILQPG